MIRFDAQGREIPDPRPMEVPAHAHRPESLSETIRRMVQHHSRLMADSGEAETLEEANDFDMDDEDEWENMPTQYTLQEESEYVDATADTDPAGQRGRQDDGGDRLDTGDVPSERAPQGHREGPQRSDAGPDAGHPPKGRKPPVRSQAARGGRSRVPDDDGGEVEPD